MRVVLQQTEQDCLLACYAMVAGAMGLRVSLGDLREWKPLPAEGLSAQYLHKLNDRYRLQMRVFRTTSGDNPIRQLEGVPCPFIVHWQGNHFVVVEQIGRRSVVIVDPELGRLRLSSEEFADKFSCNIIVLQPGDDFARADQRHRVGPHLTELLPAPAVATLAVSLLLVQILTLGTSAAVRQLLQPPPPSWWAGAIVAGLVGVLAGAGFFMRWMGQRRCAESFEHQYTQALFWHLLAQPLSFFKGQSHGTLLEKINLRLLLKDAVILTILPSALSLVSVALVMGYLVWVSPLLAVVLVACSVLYLSANVMLLRRQREANQTYVQAQIDLASRTQSTLQNIDEVKATAAEDSTLQRWNGINRRAAEHYQKVLCFSGAAGTIQMLYLSITLVIIALVGGHLVGQGRISLADIVVFQTGLAMFAGLLSETQSMVSEIVNIEVYRDKQADIWSPTVSEGRVLNGEHGQIAVVDFGFAYPGSSPICEGLNICIERGDKVAIVGESGSGKSTLLYALLGLTDFSGELRIGQRGFRQRTGVLFPRMTLVDGTVRSNLVGDAVQVDDESLWRCLHAVNMLEVVAELPGRLDARVREGGTNFSTGQAQRLLLARSLIRGREFVFWDEALSGLDKANREIIYRRVLESPDFCDTTMIMVTHDPGAVEHCDWKIELGLEATSAEMTAVKSGSSHMRV